MAKVSKKGKEYEVLILQLIETEPEQLMKISAIFWGTTGAAIGSLFIFISLIGILLNYVSLMGGIFLLFSSIIITITLSFFYALTGAALGSMTSKTVNWILEKMGGIQLKVRKLN